MKINETKNNDYTIYYIVIRILRITIDYYIPHINSIQIILNYFMNLKKS